MSKKNLIILSFLKCNLKKPFFTFFYINFKLTLCVLFQLRPFAWLLSNRCKSLILTLIHFRSNLSLSFFLLNAFCYSFFLIFYFKKQACAFSWCCCWTLFPCLATFFFFVFLSSSFLVSLASSCGLDFFVNAVTSTCRTLHSCLCKYFYLFYLLFDFSLSLLAHSSIKRKTNLSLSFLFSHLICLIFVSFAFAFHFLFPFLECN